MLISRQHYPLLFVTLTIILLITEWFITQSQSFQLRSDALSLGVTVDVALGVPVLYYLLVVRTGR